MPIQRTGELVVITQLMQPGQKIPPLQKGGSEIADHRQQRGHQREHPAVRIIHAEKADDLPVCVDRPGGQGMDVLRL